tara:strand:- start:1088 stop:1324 length:237 start_codon:yes stop_codon:yes gene_type:complete
MIEPFVPILVAVGTGFAVLTTRIYNRISHLDNRVDSIELRVVQEFVTKDDFNSAMERMEAHMVRIETKLDNLVNRNIR